MAPAKKRLKVMRNRLVKEEEEEAAVEAMYCFGSIVYALQQRTEGRSLGVWGGPWPPIPINHGLRRLQFQWEAAWTDSTV